MGNKQTIWTKPIYIHVMPQLHRKVSLHTAYLTLFVWVSTISLVAVCFFIK